VSGASSAKTAEVAEPQYGIDAPGVVRTLAITGVMAIVLSLATRATLGPFALPLEAIGVILLGQVMLMIRTSRVTKRQEWEEMLDGIGLRGNERVLDVGCGTGLVSVLAAKRLDRGKVTGVDVWRRKDISGNSAKTAKKNAAAEGVAKRITFRECDARELSFADGSFDVVLSSMALHNLPSRTERGRAIREIDRVLSPGGRVAILDVTRTHEYENRLREAGYDDIVRAKRNWGLFPPARLVTATKPAA
jgi:SAM-dependent methyltransferase